MQYAYWRFQLSGPFLKTTPLLSVGHCLQDGNSKSKVQKATEQNWHQNSNMDSGFFDSRAQALSSISTALQFLSEKNQQEC